MPDSLSNLFSVTEFGKAMSPDDYEELTEGTSAQTFARHSFFKWENKKHERTFVNLPNSIPVLAFNDGHNALKAFRSALQDSDASNLRCTLSSSKDKGNHEEATGLVNYIRALQVVMNRSEGDIALGIFMKHHVCLHHLPLSLMYLLSEEGKMQNHILEIKSTSPFPLCLFGKAHRKPWRTNADPGCIKRIFKPGNYASVDEMVMSSLGLTT